jgi:NADPH-dependent 2,4-dienoyl-CoA reductase/sulfur reductase-like enzyme/rhodanese-related sulfurtransferase
MSEHVVIIGAVAAGPKSACRYKRLKPSARVTMIDRGDVISYGGCGIPYYVGGEVSEAMQLRTTSFHMVRDESFFKETKGVDVFTQTEAVKIDRDKKQVHTKNLRTGEQGVLEYDKLVIATGAKPRKLNLPGEDLEGVHYVSNPHDAVKIREAVTKGAAQKAVVVGAGFIGLEMAEAFADMWDIRTTVVEITDQIMSRYVSPVLAAMGKRHMEEKGVQFVLGESVKEFRGVDGRVTQVVTNERTIDADVVVISVGVVPCSDLAKNAGLKVHNRGGIFVDESMRTNDPDIFAAGDCVLIKNEVTGNTFYLPMGSMANKQGRVVGTNLAGGDAKFEGGVGSFVVKLFDKSLAGSGLSLEVAQMSGFDAMSVILVQLDRAHFYPTKELMTLELVFDRKTRQVLGIQGYGAASNAMVGRINLVGGMLRTKPTIDYLSNMEMAYSPPFSSAIDILNTLANMADNALAGMNVGVGPDTFKEIWNDRDSGKHHFLDCRESVDARPYLERHPDVWHNIPQGKIYEQLDKIPRDKDIMLICNTGGRSYEAQIMLRHMGYENVVNLHGGMAILKQWGLEL